MKWHPVRGGQKREQISDKLAPTLPSIRRLPLTLNPLPPLTPLGQKPKRPQSLGKVQGDQ